MGRRVGGLVSIKAAVKAVNTKTTTRLTLVAPRHIKATTSPKRPRIATVVGASTGV